MLKRISRFFIFSLLVYLQDAQADSFSFSLPPRFSANALASDYTVGQADLMLSTGDCAHNFYLDPDIAYGSDNQGYADLGVGYRWIQNNAAILGAYVFGGYSRVDNNARLWVVNPGIEAMGSRWDARLNAYFPMGDRHYGMGEFHEPLNLDYAVIIGHSAYSNPNRFFYVSQYAGEGADVKVGYQLFPQTPLKAYLGSYFFSPAQTSNIWGGAAGLEYWFDPHVKFMAGYTYDTLRHSTGALGIGVEFGGTHVHRSDPDLEERITDPVERYLAELGRGSAIPSRRKSQFLGYRATLLANNIAFFSQTGTPNNGGAALTLANCTFENPCGPTDFSQPGVDTLNVLLPNTLLFFNGGSYPALNVAGTGPITLNAGQSVRSRTTDYLNPAAGAARSTFNGAFILNSSNTLNNIILLSTPATASGNGVQANTVSNILINGSQIGGNINLFNRGVQFTDVSQGVISNSNLFSNFDTVFVNGTSTLSIQSSSLTASSTVNSTFSGLHALGNSFIDVMDSTITVTGATSASTFLRGITAENSAMVQGNNIELRVTNSGNGQTRALLTNTSTTLISIANSLLSITASNAGIRSGAISTMPITNSVCIINNVVVVC